MTPDCTDYSMSRERLLASIDDVESASMGLDVLRGLRKALHRQAATIGTAHSPVQSGIVTAFGYAVAFCGAPFLVHLSKPAWLPSFDQGLYGLQAYGALWAGWSTITTNLTVTSLGRTISREIAPRLGDATMFAIEQDVRRILEHGTRLRDTWLIGLALALIGGGLIFTDLHGRVSVPEVAYWSLGWWLLFSTSAGVVNVGRFYAAFADHLHKETDSLYVVDPTRSTLVKSVDSLGHRMLLFWFMIAVSIAIIFVVKRADTAELSASNFIVAQVAGAGFFSLGIGTWIFLGTQVAIRRAVWATVNPTLIAIEARTAELLSGIRGMDEAEWKRLEQLDDLHAKIATSWSLRSKLLSAGSLVLPFIPVAGTIATHLLN